MQAARRGDGGSSGCHDPSVRYSWAFTGKEGSRRLGKKENSTDDSTDGEDEWVHNDHGMSDEAGWETGNQKDEE